MDQNPRGTVLTIGMQMDKMMTPYIKVLQGEPGVIEEEERQSFNLLEDSLTARYPVVREVITSILVPTSSLAPLSISGMISHSTRQPGINGIINRSPSISLITCNNLRMDRN
jgi:hypothetical protein